LYLACVSHVDVHKEEIQLTIDQSPTGMFQDIFSLFFNDLFVLERHNSSKKLVDLL
jgi:hypothetical protein